MIGSWYNGIEIMKARLIFTVITSLIDEVVIVAVIIWGFPYLGLKVPLWALITIVVGFAIIAVFSFKIGNRVLMQKPLAGFTDMIGTEGLTTSRLNPDGFVKIDSELWAAKAEKGHIEAGQAVVVISQNGLDLVVQLQTPENAVENQFHAH